MTRWWRQATALALWMTLAVGATVTAAPAHLESGRLAARFGDRGLLAIGPRDSWPRGAVELTTEEWALTIDGKAIDSRSLPRPTRTSRASSVTYTWNAPPFVVIVTYAVQQDWAFISKQITISTTQPFRVDEVTVFDSRLAEGAAIASDFTPKSARPAALGTGDYGICLRLGDTRGLLVVAQNPFLESRRIGQTVTVRYRPDMAWQPSDGPFIADRGLIGLTTLTGRTLPTQMVAEWKLPAAPSAPGMDEGEVAAFTAMVRAFVLAKPDKPVNVFVPWCLNDYQIDIGTKEGRAEYTKLIANAAALGANYAIFAPTNSDLAKREDSTDDWSWENLLWAGFGQKLRKNEWDPKTGSIPASVQEMLDVAAANKVKLLAYVYPVLAFSQNPDWLSINPPPRAAAAWRRRPWSGRSDCRRSLGARRAGPRRPRC